MQQIIKDLRLIDDVFFNMCFENNPEDVQYVLRIILDKPDLIVNEVQTQTSVENIYGRSVRFDIFANDNEGKLYNIEMQRTDKGAIPLRARYNSAMIDYHELQKGVNFDKLPESYVIFITENDTIGDGKLLYHIDRVVQETGKFFADGTHIIYLNCSFNGETKNELTQLIHDFFCADPLKIKHKQIAKRVNFLKNNFQKEERQMHWLMEKYFSEEAQAIADRVRAEITEEVTAEVTKNVTAEVTKSVTAEVTKNVTAEVTKNVTAEVTKNVSKNNSVNNVRSLMRNLNMTVEDAMNALSISPEMQKEIAPLI